MASKDFKEEIRQFWKTKLNRIKTWEKFEPKEKVLALNAGEKKVTTRVEIYSRENVTIVSSMAIERQNVGETAIKMTT